MKKYDYKTMKKTNQPKETMKQCKICNDQPKEIYSQCFNTYICKPCMENYGDTHHDKIGTYPNNYIPSDYYTLIKNY